MNLELHILQNFAPSNLNRDDTGSPKSCEFGGYRRARISSQCLKRAIREQFKVQDTGLEQAQRTKRIVEVVTKALAADQRDPATALTVVQAALGSIGLATATDGQYESAVGNGNGAPVLTFPKTQYLLFVGEREVQALTDFCRAHWDALAAADPAAEGGRGKKKTPTAELPKGAADGLKRALDGGRAADLALFGRMLADLPERNIDAASQVAHAISTHQVGIEFDYYTAVDDLKPDDTAGADMIGTVEFNSACYYRYANIDLGQLRKNLGGDGDLARKAVEAFLVASRDAEPTGKQNSFSARNKPSFVFAVVRDSGFWSLANAFARPVRPQRDEDIVGESIERLAGHWRDLVKMYGEPSGLTTAWTALGDGHEGLLPGRVDSYSDLMTAVMGAIRFQEA